MGNGTTDVLVGASERVLEAISSLYVDGVSPGGQAGGLGLLAIASHPLVGLSGKIRKPRKKISVMIIGNHSAGKSSFINWYIGEQVCRTGVAIETRGFIIVSSARRRETLAGDATLRYFSHLAGLTQFSGILPNLFAELTTSQERSFRCIDFVDTPGLVDGDMKYPFPVEDGIVWMAEHADLIMVFLDPIGQATCKRTMDVVQRLNSGPHLEKLHYFMSKADEVVHEADRQRVLIQITQNLATRIRNSHAFNLPTFYLPHEDELPCSIPNAIDDVCDEIDRAIRQTVQKSLRQLKEDAFTVSTAAGERLRQDGARRATNRVRTLQGLAVLLAAAALAAALMLLLAVRASGALCPQMPAALCYTPLVQTLAAWEPSIEAGFASAAAALAAAVLVALGAGRALWSTAPVLTKRELQRLSDFQALAVEIGARGEALYEEYFDTLAPAAGER